MATGQAELTDEESEEMGLLTGGKREEERGLCPWAETWPTWGSCSEPFVKIILDFWFWAYEN